MCLDLYWHSFHTRIRLDAENISVNETAFIKLSDGSVNGYKFVNKHHESKHLSNAATSTSCNWNVLKLSITVCLQAHKNWPMNHLWQSWSIQIGSMKLPSEKTVFILEQWVRFWNIVHIIIIFQCCYGGIFHRAVAK